VRGRDQDCRFRSAFDVSIDESVNAASRTQRALQNDYSVKIGGYFAVFVGLLVAAFFSTDVACMR
jgi:hypothetical protein